MFEPLEGRSLPAIGFASAFALAASVPSAQHVAIDADGDTYVTGTFLGTANFDPAMSAGGVVSGSTNAPDTFIARYSSGGTLDWITYFASLSSGTTGDGSLATSIAVDDQTGELYVVGQFQGTVNFDPQGAPLVLTSSDASASDAFIAMLPTTGNMAAGMVKTFGNGMGGPAFNGVALGPSGQGVYVTGGFSGTVNFDPGGTNTSLTSPPSGDAFALGLTNTLGFVFVSEINVNSAEGRAITVTSTGTVAIAGVIPATEDSFVATFSTAGGAPAVREFLGGFVPGASIFANALVTDGTNLYLAGTFTGIGVNFNATTGTPAITLDSRGESDAFLLMLDPQLAIVWALRFGSTGADTGTSLAIDPSGNLYLTGWVSGAASYGTSGPGSVIFLPGNGLSATPDTYVLEVDPSGNPTIPAVGPTGSGSSMATGIAVNSAGTVVIVGTYSPPILFGSTYLQAPGTTVPFVATLTPTAPGTEGGSGGGGTPGGGAGGGGGNTGVTATPALYVTDEQRITTGKGRTRRVIGFRLFFNAALDASTAVAPGSYQVTQQGPARRSPRKVIHILSATPGPGETSVSLLLGKFTSGKPLLLTFRGLLGSAGTPVTPTTIALH